MSGLEDGIEFRPSILVVEDEVIVSMSIESNLRSCGYRLAGQTSSGTEAVKIATELKPDLVLMDIKLDSSMDGVTAAQEIQRNLDIPVIFITAYSDEETLTRARKVLPYGYILKPFDVSSLKPSIEMALYKHKMERELSLSEQRYKAIVEDQSDLIVRFKPDGIVTYANDAFCSYYFIKPDKTVGAPLPDLVASDHKKMVETHMASLTPESPIGMLEVAVIRDNNHTAWQQWVIKAIFDKRKNLVEYQLAARDISERHWAEEQLKESERRHRIISDLMSDYVYSAEITNDGTVEPQWISGAIEEITEYSFEEIKNMEGGLASICHPEDISELERVQQKLMSNRPVVHQYRIRTKSGKVKWLRDHIKPVWDFKRQRLVGFVGAVADNTSQKELEEKLTYQANILQQLPHPLITTDFALFITTWNNAAANLFGYNSWEAIGRSLIELTNLHDENTWIRDLQQRENFSGVWNLHTRSGQRIKANISVNILRDLKNLPRGLVIFLQKAD